MEIRPEKPSDYNEVADVHHRAFGHRSDEATIVALLRQRNAYDVDLSLVATDGQQLLGHALFMPYNVYFEQEPVPGVCLAPIAVHPDFQKQGIGSALMSAGHRVAEAKGYKIAFLLGHSTYYPRFGYQTGVFGSSSVTLTRDQIAEQSATVTARSPLPDDIPALRELWLYEEQAVDFTLRPEGNLNGWLSPNPAFKATVYLWGQRLIGYTRGPAAKPRVFLAHSSESAQAIAAHLLQTHDEIVLPLHPMSQSIKAFDVSPPNISGWEAAMLKVLVDTPVVSDYLAGVKSGERIVGRLVWPPAFDLS